MTPRTDPPPPPNAETHSLSDDPFFALRNRAYELADTGHFKVWDQIAFALQKEGFPSALITRMNRDKLAVMMITRCCDQARSAASAHSRKDAQ